MPSPTEANMHVACMLAEALLTGPRLSTAAALSCTLLVCVSPAVLLSCRPTEPSDTRPWALELQTTSCWLKMTRSQPGF